MGKSNIFVGHPVFGQIISLIPASLVSGAASKLQSDRYYKAFKTYDHLVTMLYAAMSGANTLRSVALGLLAADTKLHHIGLAKAPPRSTISDGNKGRPSKVFEEVHRRLYEYYKPLFSDSRLADDILGRLKLVDSTTISLFKDILKAVGRTPADGRRKGGIKAHVTLDTTTGLPRLVIFSASASSDNPHLDKAGLVRGDIAVFDMGYCNYGRFMRMGEDGISFVTRQKDGSLYTVLAELPVSEFCGDMIASDQVIEVVDPESKKSYKLRRIVRKADDKNQELVFWTNIMTLNPDTIAKIYKHRWTIELLFRSLKQNFPLKYFLGDNQNAIEIQIWCCLISHLLYRVLLKQTKAQWAFSNLCDLIRQHLFTYIAIIPFLDNPEKALSDRAEARNKGPDPNQISLF